MSEYTNPFENKWNVEISVAVENVHTAVELLRETDVSTEGIIQNITAVLSNSFSALRTLTTKALNKEQKLLSLNENQLKKFNQNNMKSNYTYLIDRQISIPAGMSGTYVNYATVSFKLSEFTKQVTPIVEQLRADIGRVLSTQNGIKDSTLFTDGFYKNQKKEMDKLLTELGKVRKGDDFNAVDSYGDVFKNNNDFFNTVEITRKGNDNINRIDRGKLLYAIETTMSYIQELNELAKKEGYSKPLIAKIGECVAIVATIVEAFSSTVFNQEMLTTSLNNVIDEVGKIV